MSYSQESIASVEVRDSTWMVKRFGRWDTFDPSPRHAYYKFLRAVYQFTASEAWERALWVKS